LLHIYRSGLGRAGRVPLHSQPVCEEDSDNSEDDLNTNRNGSECKSVSKTADTECRNTTGQIRLNAQTVCSDFDNRNFKPGNLDMNCMSFLNEDVSRCKPVAKADDTDSKAMAVCGVHNGGMSCLQG
jgi:hypothetical protein